MYTVWRSGLVENFPTVHDIDLYQTDPMFHGHLSKKSPLIFPNFQVSAGGRDALIDRFFLVQSDYIVTSIIFSQKFG